MGIRSRYPTTPIARAVSVTGFYNLRWSNRCRPGCMARAALWSESDRRSCGVIRELRSRQRRLYVPFTAWRSHVDQCERCTHRANLGSNTLMRGCSAKLISLAWSMPQKGGFAARHHCLKNVRRAGPHGRLGNPSSTLEPVRRHDRIAQAKCIQYILGVLERVEPQGSISGSGQPPQAILRSRRDS
jgi:hypothetical protein